MALEALSSEDQRRLKEVVEQGLDATQRIADLREGLADTIKTVAAELNIEPSAIKDAIRLSFSGKIEEKKEAMSTVEEILHITGRA